MSETGPERAPLLLEDAMGTIVSIRARDLRAIYRTTVRFAGSEVKALDQLESAAEVVASALRVGIGVVREFVHAERLNICFRRAS